MAEPTPDKGSIVVIDDTPANLRLLTGMLMKEGYKVRPMPSGELGLESVRAAPPDLILLDINMPPGIDGYEVCRRLKANPETSDIPVIFISALGESLDKVQAFEVGGVDYITKPFKVEEVQARIHTHLELKLSRDRMAEINRTLTRSLDEKNEFVGVLANELKNPLNVLLGYSEMMAEDAGSLPDQEVVSISKRMADTSRKMHDLVTEILEVHQLELGNRSFVMRAVDLNAVICGVLGNFEEAAKAKGLKLVYIDLRDFPTVRADESSLYSIVENLISNAVKFSSRGGRISVSLTRDEETAKCTVSDRGPGFTDQDKQRLFTKYARLSARPTAGETSTGLGLSIVKALVDVLGGTITLESEPGQGSAFTLTLPLAR